jgi:hypothetical protein
MPDRAILTWEGDVSIGCLAADCDALASAIELIAVPLCRAADLHIETGEHPPYQSTAVVPDLPRRRKLEPVVVRPHGSLCDGVNGPPVAIVGLSEAIVEAIWDLAIPFATSKRALKQVQDQPEFEALIAATDAEIRALFPGSEASPWKVNGVCINDVGQITVTENALTRERIGFHVDSWDRQALVERTRTQPRICVNLSAQDRLFLFHPRPVYDLWHAETGGSDDGADATRFTRAFVRERYAELECIGVTVPPGCAYWGLTENLIHDASTFFRSQFDVNYTVRGDFFLSAQLPASGG